MSHTKKWSAAALAASMILASSGLTGHASVSAANITTSMQNVQQPAVTLKYKGQTLTQQGRLINGNTMIPVTVLRDAFGLPLSYDAGSKSYTVGSGITKLHLAVSQYGVSTTINGYYIYSNTDRYEVKNVNGHLYVPFQLLNDYLGFQGSYNAADKSLTISKRVMNDLTLSTVHIDKSNTNATIQIAYPQISGFSTASEQKINALFKQQADNFAAESLRQASQRDGTIERKYEFMQSFAVTFNREGVLGVVVDQYGYWGGAHGGTVRKGLTFSLNTGNQLGLGDLLKSNPDYKTKLDKLLKERTKKDSFPDIIAGLDKQPDFYLKEGGIVIFYQQYEIAPYAAGILSYPFLFSELLGKSVNPFGKL